MTMQQTFHNYFGEGQETFRIFSPYRICPLGAHVDHQKGLVSGFAIDKGIDFLLSPDASGEVEVVSLTFEGLTTCNVRSHVGPPRHNWGDYLKGVVGAMQHDFPLRIGLRGVVRGSLPVGGLSSSAALLCGFAAAIDKVNNLGLTKMQLIHYASRAEREYVGLKNGILDQACVTLSEKGKLLFMDTRDQSYSLIPCGRDVPLKAGIFFSGVTRKLTGTDYNLRVSECKVAAWNLAAYEGLPLRPFEDTVLRNIDAGLLAKHGDKMPARFARRAKHFHTECERVRQGVEAWREGDIERFGQLVFQSCESSIHQYECGSPELIALYDILSHTPGVYGGRFSGAGFKGACIALIDPAYERDIAHAVMTEYLERFPQYAGSAQAYFCDFADGVRILENT